MGVPVAGARRGGRRTPSRARRPAVLPDEFMRGGGCFAPDATVLKADPTADGASAACGRTPCALTALKNVRRGRGACDGARRALAVFER